jgi:hypothetical protein
MYMFNERTKLNMQVEGVNIFTRIVSIWQWIDVEDTWTSELG